MPGSRLRDRIPKASTILADELREHIVRERLPVDAAMPSESELIASSGLARGTVREALRLLEAEGLITIRRGPSGGIQVARPNVEHVTRSMSVLLALSDARVRDLFVFRRLLEPMAARFVAERATPEQRAYLVEACEAADQGGVDFHVALASICDNDFLRVTLGFTLEIADWQTTSERLGGDDMTRAHKLHGRIAELIRAGDGDGAAATMVKHLDEYEAVMVERGRMDAPLLRSPESAK